MQENLNKSDASGGAIDRLLLRDFRPVSRLVVPVTQVPKAKYPVIDMHCHGRQGSGGRELPAEHDIRAWIAAMDAVNVEKSVVLTMANGELFKTIADLCEKFSERLYLFCGFYTADWEKPDFPKRSIADLKACIRNGAKGIGEIVDKGSGILAGSGDTWSGLHLFDEKCQPVMDACAAFNIPISLHTGDPVWSYLEPDGSNEAAFSAQIYNTYGQGLPGMKEQLEWQEKILNLYPRNRFILCHLGNLSHDLAAFGALLDAHPAVYADFSGRFTDLARQPRQARNFFIRYQDRLLYGTDMGTDQSMYSETFRVLETADEYFDAPGGGGFQGTKYSKGWKGYGLDLPDQVLKKIYNTNAAAVMK
ncbi:MAG: hypothetical protein A2096_00955 [Spirochaetes bacterium GWF1_41_5]|nr:MAG: hypothetical protein A2096_00955 [Spirochaetes bacterium GWF1_41_5]